MNDFHSPNRRDAMALATAAAVSASGIAHGKTQDKMATPLEDPTTKYPKPPFKRQQQPWPGLARDMDPRPDHGETRYRGSARLAGRKALITGGDSGMGRAAAIAYAREGADVAINYYPSEEPDAKEVVALIEKAGRKGGRDPRRSARRDVLQGPGRARGEGDGRARHRRLQRGASTDPCLDPRSDI
jgi:hypothetical protein